MFRSKLRDMNVVHKEVIYKKGGLPYSMDSHGHFEFHSPVPNSSRLGAGCGRVSCLTPAAT